MLTFLMIAMIAFFVTSGVFLSIEARKRSQLEAASSSSSANRETPSQSAAEATTKPKMPKAA
jgi:hypothetical protein